MTTSGISNFDPSLSDIILEAFDRLEMRPTELTSEHVISARRSLNFELTAWSSQVPLLWAIDSQTIPLQQGVATYTIPSDTVTMLDTYVRTYQLSNQFNVTPAFSTTLGSATVAVSLAANGVQPGFWINIKTPVAVGGILLYGFYQVDSLNSANSFNVIASGVATSTVSIGGILAQFVSTSSSSSVTVNLPNHGLAQSNYFNVQVTTLVGGIYLSGQYTVQSVISPNSFVIATQEIASYNDAQYENLGLCQFMTQSANADPIDRILIPIGRTDYAMYPDKFVQSVPSVYWQDRTINPTVTLYQVPDGNGPYSLIYYRMRRLQNANPSMGQTADVHFRFLDALCAKLAARLAIKYAKPMLAVLAPAAKDAWDNAIGEERERAENFIMPDLSGYYRI